MVFNLAAQFLRFALADEARYHRHEVTRAEDPLREVADDQPEIAASLLLEQLGGHVGLVIHFRGNLAHPFPHRVRNRSGPVQRRGYRGDRYAGGIGDIFQLDNPVAIHMKSFRIVP